MDLYVLILEGKKAGGIENSGKRVVLVLTNENHLSHCLITEHHGQDGLGP